jgi:hypothetical protein
MPAAAPIGRRGGLCRVHALSGGPEIQSNLPAQRAECGGAQKLQPPPAEPQEHPPLFRRDAVPRAQKQE